ncbi:formylglycine-generating enzyme family protein [Paramicrobacterium agarici]|uniref:formylglycine-generating enzyme family protein n=1 Tax=Paramicrobacterium agarici TaxID=630514 RepID=UPI0011538A8B|nr:formylglycine-generating enzyme family protein [Microbacterium agarici]TQO23080.1 formylglycine-generating enzyme required for sulfatase activity [Microbacterium agarici]
MHDDMVLIPAGEFRMGSEGYYPEEAPVFTVHVDDFSIDRHPVTNRQFREFVEATGYVTVAEKGLDAAEFPQLSEADRAPGSLVFHETEGPVDLRNWRAWWSWGTGADWQHPFGPDSSIEGKDDHPVVQVCYTDAVAYAAWAGKRLPTEEEWERAARGNLDGADFAWGDDLTPNGELRANTWQGSFPYDNTGALGWKGTSPVGTFPANDFGLVDMIGNVWEWTSSRFTPNHREAALAASLAAPIGRSLVTTAAGDGSGEGCGCGCGPESSRSAAGTVPASSSPDSSISHVTKGGSHLCAPEYCQRYRPAARSPQTEDSATTHLGFRCARSA